MDEESIFDRAIEKSSPAERAAFAFTLKLTKTPQAMTDADIAVDATPAHRLSGVPRQRADAGGGVAAQVRHR